MKSGRERRISKQELSNAQTTGIACATIPLSGDSRSAGVKDVLGNFGEDAKRLLPEIKSQLTAREVTYSAAVSFPSVTRNTR